MVLLWTHSNIVNVVRVSGAADLDTVLQVESHKSRIEGKISLSQVDGHFSCDAAQDAVGFLGCRRTLLSHAELLIHEHPQVFLPRANFDPFFTQPALNLEVDLTHVLDLALDLVELREAPRDQLLKSVKVSGWHPFPSSMLTASHSFLLSADLLRVCLFPLFMLLTKMLSSTSPNTEEYCFPLGHWLTDHISLSATIWPIPYPPSGPCVKSVSPV